MERFLPKATPSAREGDLGVPVSLLSLALFRASAPAPSGIPKHFSPHPKTQTVLLQYAGMK